MDGRLRVSIKNLSSQRIYSFCFLVLVFVLLAVQLFGKDVTITSVSEHFLFRKKMISSYLQFKYKMGDKLYSGIVVGDIGWLFYTRELSLRNYQKVDPLNISNIKKLTNVLEKVDEIVKTYGGTFVVVVAPDKSTIYPQFMPEEVPIIGNETSLDRLINRINKNTDVRLIDLRPTLIEQSETSRVYYKTDTHWNCLGAYYSYTDIMLNLLSVRSDIKILPIDRFAITSQEMVLDLAGIMELDVKEGMEFAKPNYDVDINSSFDPKWSSSVDELKIFKNSEDDLPSLMVFHDSFYNACLSSYMVPSFGTTYSVMYNKIRADQIFEIIEDKKPQIVVFQFAERFMDYFLWQFTE